MLPSLMSSQNPEASVCVNKNGFMGPLSGAGVIKTKLYPINTVITGGLRLSPQSPAGCCDDCHAVLGPSCSAKDPEFSFSP